MEDGCWCATLAGCDPSDPFSCPDGATCICSSAGGCECMPMTSGCDPRDPRSCPRGFSCVCDPSGWCECMGSGGTDGGYADAGTAEAIPPGP
jgi:hypothetical protein